jgi:DNA-binding transcriptional ArsR family regulator
MADGNELSDANLDELMRALSHSVRRRILAMTLERRMSAGAIVETLGLPAASVSEHLKVLRKTGLTLQTRDATWRYYRADPELLGAVAARLNRLKETGEP